MECTHFKNPTYFDIFERDKKLKQNEGMNIQKQKQNPAMKWGENQNHRGVSTKMGI